jgi:hypothetical protein
LILTIAIAACGASAAALAADTSRPSIAIVAPTAAGTLSTSSNEIALAGTAQDNVRVAKVTWSNSRGGSGTATGTSAWSVPRIALLPGTNSIVVRAIDASGNRRRAWLTVNCATATGTTTTASNLAPVISGAPPTTVVAGSAYSFTPAATDPESQPLNFTVAGMPSWATFSTATGTLRGTPGTADVGTVASVVIRASDGVNTTALPAFSLSVLQNATGRATVSWLPPASRTNGSALTNLAGYRIRYGTSASALNRTVPVANPGLTSFMVEGLTPGTWHFGVVAYDTAGNESALSNTASKTIL